MDCLLTRDDLLLGLTAKFVAVHHVVEDVLALLVKLLLDQFLELLPWEATDLLLGALLATLLTGLEVGLLLVL